ncbi:hypothetical protein [Brucella tritici]|uniref:hypothetical protein n=1 Tax=Brucella tritici TaxID=94626 RepID=UPI0015912353|nr:hypothetical protein [Brucella tritici]
MVTISESTRRTTYQPTTPTTVFPVGYPIFDNDDLRVTLDGEPFLSFTVSGTYINGIATDAAINVTGPGIIGDVVIDGYRLPRRTDQYKNGAPLKIEDHNYSLNRVEITLQELRRDTDDNTSRIDGMIDEVTDITERAETAASKAETANTAAQQAKDESEQARDEAVAAAAGVNLPSVSIGNAGQTLVVKPDGSGYDLRTTTISVPTRTVLKALSVVFKSVYLTEAGREGTFISKAGSPPVADTQEGVYVVSNTAGYYWERVYAPMRVPSVTAFGAKLDGVTDDSPAIRGALSVCKEAFIPRTDTGFVAGDIDINPALGHVISTVGCPTWKIKDTASCAIRVLPGAVAGKYARISLFLYDGQAAPNTSGAILINTSSGIVLGLRIEGITAKDCGFAYKEEDSASNYVVDFTIGDTLCYFTRGRQIYSRRSRGFFNWNDIKVDNTYNVAGGRPVVTWNSIYFGDMIGLEFNKIDVVGQVPGSLAHQPSAYGVIIDGIVSTGRGSIYGRRILVDNSTGHGVLMTDVFNCEVEIIQGFQVLGAPITMTRVKDSTFSKIKTYGALGLTNAVPAQSGFIQQSCSYVTVLSFEGENNLGSGSVMSGCSDCSILGGYSKNNGAYGYLDDGGARNKRVGVTARGNTSGSLFQNAASCATFSWTPDNGTPIASTIGVTTV